MMPEAWRRFRTLPKLILLLCIALFTTAILLINTGEMRRWAEQNHWRPYEVSPPVTLTNPTSTVFTSTLSKVAWQSEKNQLQVMDTATRKVLWRRTYTPIYPLLFNSDNTLLFAAHRVLDARSGRLIRQVPLTEQATVHWSDNGEIAAWIVKSNNKARYISVWNARKDSVTKFGMDPKIHLIAISPDGRWLAHFTKTSPAGFQLCLRSVSGDNQTRRFSVPAPAPIFFSPDSKTVRWSRWIDESYTEEDEPIWNPHLESRAWSIASDTPEVKLIHNENREDSVEIRWSDNGRWLVARTPFQFYVYDTRTGKKCWSSPKAYRNATLVSFTKEGRIYFFERDSSLENRYFLSYWDLKQVLTRQ